MRKAQDDTEQRREHHRFYAGKRWTALRAEVGRRDIFCQRCGEPLGKHWAGAHKIPRETCVRLKAAMDAMTEQGLPANHWKRLPAIAQILAPDFKVALEDGAVLMFFRAKPLPGTPPSWVRAKAGETELFRHPLALIADGWDLALDADNVEALDKPCHDRETGRETMAKRNRGQTRGAR
jgi:5-methylcytosine-specific restriction endonuclease McrA